MKTFDRFLTWIAIICVLILATMGVVSAGSWGPSYGVDSGVLYRPYAPIDHIIFTDNGNNISYTLQFDDRFYAYPGYSESGTSREIVLNLTGEGDTIYQVYVTVDYNSLSNGNYKLSFTLPVNQLPGFGLSDGWELRAVTENVLISNSRTSNSFVPTFTFLGMDSNFRCSYSNTTSLRYYNKSSSGNSFDKSSSFTWSRDSWTSSNLTGSPLLFRYPQVYDEFSSQNSSTKTYVTNGMFWVDQTSTTVTSEYGITGVKIDIPFVQADTIVPLSSYLSYFDLGRYETETIIQTSIVTVTPPPSGGYPDFTTFLVTAVAGFMDFGFFGISIAGILAFILIFKLVRAFINFFAGG